MFQRMKSLKIFTQVNKKTLFSFSLKIHNFFLVYYEKFKYFIFLYDKTQ